MTKAEDDAANAKKAQDDAAFQTRQAADQRIAAEKAAQQVAWQQQQQAQNSPQKPDGFTTALVGFGKEVLAAAGFEAGREILASGQPGSPNDPRRDVTDRFQGGFTSFQKLTNDGTNPSLPSATMLAGLDTKPTQQPQPAMNNIENNKVADWLNSGPKAVV